MWRLPLTALEILVIALVVLGAIVWALRKQGITWGPPKRWEPRPRPRRRPLRPEPPPASLRVPAAPPPAHSLEGKLATLAKCGFELAAPFTPEELLTTWPREVFEKPGFLSLVVALAMTESAEPFRSRCANLWYFDPECVEGDGAYVDLAGRLSEMARGALPLTDLDDYVDYEANEAWMSFVMHGRPYRFDLEINDDWIDSTIFGRFDELLSDNDDTLQFALQFTSGQHIVVACVTFEQQERLNSLEGLSFQSA